MELEGTPKDIENMLGCLGPCAGFEVSHKENATEETMIEELNSLPVFTLCLIYIQGHGFPGSYVTNVINGRLEEVTSEVIYNTLFESSFCRTYLLVSDFCYAGGYYGLKYRLCLEQSTWVLSKHWNGKESDYRAIHFAGADSDQLVYEGDNTGGYFTMAFAETWNLRLTLLDRLRGIRDSVSAQYKKDEEKCEFKGPQIPQVYSSFEADLEDPDVLRNLHLGSLPVFE